MVTTDPRAGGVGFSAVRALFAGGVFLGSLLLFLVEPMAAKELLPIFGGSSAVWITCLFFFQAALLVGYLYAHGMTQGAGPGRRMWVHWALLGGAVVCAVLWASGKAPLPLGVGHPVSGILCRLAVSIGVPFVLLAATSPLLQVWLNRVEAGRFPYQLFGLSNLASMVALIAYPSVIEPYLSLRVQREAWSAGVVVFCGVSAALAWRVRGAGAGEEGIEAQVEDAATPWTRRALWLLLPMAGAMQLSAVTQHLTVNVAAIPLLWILPLATYLLTFVVAFQYPRLVPRTVLAGLMAVLLFALGNFLTRPELAVPIGLSIGFFLAELLVACLLCHTELYALRPRSSQEATVFYLMIAAGGAAGSFLVGVAAPLVFRDNYDLLITFAVTAAVVLAATWRDGAKQRMLWGASTVVLLGLCGSLRGVYRRDSLMSLRNFYGSLRVKQDVSVEGDAMRTLMHGSIVHGTQIFSPELMRVPTTYYARDSGVGLALAACCGQRGRRIGVVGLGTGTVAAYGRAGDRMRFYEINPAVEPVARNWFTYLRQTAAEVTVVGGDARASLAREAPQGFDVLVVDAFSGDAIPLHLLTVEAMAVYRRQLAQGGVLAFHVSNQYVDLEPELAALAQASGMAARRITSPGEDRRGEFEATWILVTDDAGLFERPEMAGAVALRSRNAVKPWTDDYSSLMPLVRW